MVAIDRDVHERHALVVHALGPVRPQDGALHAYARVPIDVALHIVGDGRRELAAAMDLLLVEGDPGHTGVYVIGVGQDTPRARPSALRRGAPP